MTDTITSDTDNLDDFEKLLYNKAEPSIAKEEDPVEEAEDDSLATETDENTEEAEIEAALEADEEAPEPVKKKNRFQERIDQLSEKARVAEEKAAADVAALKRQLDEALSKLQPVKETPAPKSEKDPNEPSPDAVLEDGSDKYPLGEYDPAFIRDLTRYSFQKEIEAQKAADAANAERRAIEDEQNKLETEWAGRLETAKEKYPDMLEKNKNLLDSFQGLDPNYGNYLATTIMNLEYGPDVLYHLANNVDEAKAIVNAGAAKATVLLGRLEARFAFQNEDKKEQKLKVSKAPTPPERLNKGSMVTKEIADDTDDLEAFTAKLYGRR